MYPDSDGQPIAENTLQFDDGIAGFSISVSTKRFTRENREFAFQKKT